MRHVYRACAVVVLVVAGGAAWAQEGLIRPPGDWQYVVVLAVLLAETVGLALVGRTGWLGGLGLAVLANAGTIALGVAGAGDGGSLLLALAVQVPLVVAGAALWHELRPHAPRALGGALGLIGVLLCANLAGGALARNLGRERGDSPLPLCADRLTALASAVLAYAEEHGGALPPAGNLVELQGLLGDYLMDGRAFACPGGVDDRTILGLRLPARTAPESYACADLRDLGPVPLPADRAHLGNWANTRLFWDAAPRHEGARFVVFLDGHVGWYPEPTYQAMLPMWRVSPAALPGGAPRG